MEHPYLTPIKPRKFATDVGEYYRAAKRHARIVRAVRLIDESIFEELPELIATPPKPLDADEFLARIARMHSILHGKSLQRRALAVAWNRLCTFVDKGNDAGDWKLPVVIPHLQLSTQPLLRTRRWQRNVNRLHISHARLVQAIERMEDHSTLNERPVAIALALYFAALYSGVCEAMLLEALAQAIIDETRLETGPEADRIWITLTIDNPSITNTCRMVDGEQLRKLEVRRKLDPLTISMIHRCWNGTGEYPDAEFNQITLVRWINQGLKKIEPEIPSLTSLKRFGEAALSILEHHTLLPHVYLEVACGRITTCDLPSNAFRRLNGFRVDVAQAEDLKLVGESDDHSAPSVRSERVSKGARDAIYSTLTSIIKEGNKKSQAIEALHSLDTEKYPLSGKLLVAWCLEHLEHRGNAMSSMRSYLSAVGVGLIDTMAHADVYDADDLDDVYRWVIENKDSDDAKAYAAARLEDLHEVGRWKFDFPALYESLTNDYKKHRHVRAAFVPEATYAAALKAVDQLPNRDRHYKRSIKSVLILAYRTGMRRNEILHLQHGDIEADDACTIFVRANSLGPLKSSSARRNLPGGPLLTPIERRIFDSICRDRVGGQRRRTSLLFHVEGNPTQALDSRQVSNDVKRVLRCAGYTGVLHDFRHTALSRLQLIAERDWSLVTQWTGYTEKQARAVYRAVFGHPRSRHNRYWALAVFAGHSSPSTTFASYLHFSADLLFESLRQASLTHSRRFLSKVTGIGRIKLGKIAKAANTGCNSLTLCDIHAKVASNHRGLLHKFRIADFGAVELDNDDLAIPRATVFVVYDAMRDYERGYSIPSIAYQHGLFTKELKRYLRKAKVLADEMTRRLRPRLISEGRAKARRALLTPARPTNHVLSLEASALIPGFKKIYKSARQDLEWAVCYWLTHTSATEPYAWFRRRADLKRLIKVFENVIPDQRWYIEVVVPPGWKDDDAVRHWKLRKSLTVVPRTENWPPKSPVARLHLRHPADSALIEQLTNRMNKSNHKVRQWIAKKYSDHTLQFLLHMLAIMIFEEESLVAALAACRESGHGRPLPLSA